MTTIILQRFANREYRLIQQNIAVVPKKYGDKYAEKQLTKYAGAVMASEVASQNLEVKATATEVDGRFVVGKFSEQDAIVATRSLDIIDEFQRSQRSLKKGGWGHLAKPTIFTKNARHRLLEAGAIIDKECGLNAWEITCTIPGNTRDAFRVVAEHTGRIMNTLTQLIRRAKCRYWFYVWELQKRGALHLHLCIADPTKALQSLAVAIESRWWDVLKSLSTESKVDVFAQSAMKTWRLTPSVWQSHIAKIQKSVAAYFSKYAGKASSKNAKKRGFHQVYTPSRWWGSSQVVKRAITLARQRYSIEASSQVGMKVMSHLNSFLETPGRIKTYKYSFDLGKSKNGTPLGGGDVCINYYDTQTFERMQTWEKEVWEYVCMIVRSADMADADIGELHVCEDTQTSQMYYKPKEDKPYLPRPLSNQLIHAGSSETAQGVRRRTPCLALRVRLQQYLSERAGEALEQQVVYEPPRQLELPF